MNNLNSILLEGEVAGEPTLSYTSEGTALCYFCLEVNRIDSKTKVKETYFFNIDTFARLAEVCAEYLRKGRGVRVVGRLVQDMVPDDADGLKSRVSIHAEHVEFRPTKEKAEAEHAEAVAV